MKIIKTLSLFLLFAYVSISCTKQGTQGEQGPQGASGATGATGPTGATGASGRDTINYFWLTASIPVGDWQSKSSNIYYSPRRLPTLDLLTDYILTVSFDTGSSTTTMQALPAINVFSTGDELTYSYGNDTVSILYMNPTMPPKQIYYKITVLVLNP